MLTDTNNPVCTACADGKPLTARYHACQAGTDAHNVAIAACAQAAHEANKAWCDAHQDPSQPHWEDAPDWQRKSALNGVVGVLNGNTPEQSHVSWYNEKAADGWVFGPVKDPARKQHPCMVPYDCLPDEQKAKDLIYVVVVAVFAKAFGIEIRA